MQWMQLSPLPLPTESISSFWGWFRAAWGSVSSNLNSLLPSSTWSHGVN